MTGFQVFRSTIIILVTLAAAYLILMTLDVWIILLVAILIASALRPLIMRLKEARVPQGIAILIVYGTLTIVSLTMLVAVLPPLVNQFIGFIQDDNRLANRIITAQYWADRLLSQSTGTEITFQIDPEEIRTAVRDLVENIRITAPTLLVDVGNFLGDFILIIVMGIYWVTSRERAAKFMVDLLPLSRQAQATTILEEIEVSLGAYVRGIVTVSVIVGALSFVVLTLLRVQGAATLSFIYGLSTAVPIVGGFVGVVLATGLAVLSSPASALIVLVVTVLIQQVENYYLSPRIMSKTSDFDEILVIVFIAAGFTLNGITGGLLAIPVAATVAILLKHMIFEPRRARVTPTRVEGGILLVKDLDNPTPTQTQTK